MPVIDAHQHFWTVGAPWHAWPPPELSALHRDFGPTDLLPLLDEQGINGTVLVQAQPNPAETEWLLALAERTRAIAGVVGWTDMAAPDAPLRIAEFARRPKLKGLRLMLQDLAPDWIAQAAIAPALAAMSDHGLVLDALIRPVHLFAIAEVAARHPELAVIVDHAAKPDMAAKTQQPWADDLSHLAAYSNVACKLSGMVTESQPGCSAADLAPYAAHVLAQFGPDRVLWGSDWPVVLLRASYDQWLAVARQLVPPACHAAVFGGNAARIYCLDLQEN